MRRAAATIAPSHQMSPVATASSHSDGRAPRRSVDNCPTSVVRANFVVVFLAASADEPAGEAGTGGSGGLRSGP